MQDGWGVNYKIKKKQAEDKIENRTNTWGGRKGKRNKSGSRLSSIIILRPILL